MLHLTSSGQQFLQPSNQMLLKVLRINTVLYGDRAFSVAEPKLWNSIPYEIRTAETQTNLNLT